MLHKLKTIVLLVALFATATIFGQKQKNSFKVKWANGLKIESANKQFKLKIGGRIMYDMGFFSLNNQAKKNGYRLKSKNGDEFRRARLFTSGTLYNNVNFKLQLDFTGGKTTLKDAFITIKKLPFVGNFRVGHFLQPYSLEAFSSSKYMIFMERSLHNSMIPERNSGLMFFNEVANKRMSWQVAFLRNANKNTSDNPKTNGSYSLITRIAGTVIKDENSLLHLGIAFRYAKPQESKKFKYSVKPEVHIADKYIKTSVSGVESINMTNLEVAYNVGSLALQGEYAIAKVNSSIKNKVFNTFYTQVSYLLTGEKRNYKNSLAGFSRVKPKNNFGKNGIGAFQIALRYSQIDGMNNDKMSNITLGINWHLNSATRIMANYVISNLDNNTQFTGKGNFNAFQMRFQIDF